MIPRAVAWSQLVSVFDYSDDVDQAVLDGDLKEAALSLARAHHAMGFVEAWMGSNREDLEGWNLHGEEIEKWAVNAVRLSAEGAQHGIRYAEESFLEAMETGHGSVLRRRRR